MAYKSQACTEVCTGRSHNQWFGRFIPMRFLNRKRVGLVLLLGSIATCGLLWLSGHAVIAVHVGGTTEVGWQTVMITWPAPVLLLVGLVGLMLLLWRRGPRSQGTHASQ